MGSKKRSVSEDDFTLDQMAYMEEQRKAPQKFFKIISVNAGSDFSPKWVKQAQAIEVRPSGDTTYEHLVDVAESESGDVRALRRHAARNWPGFPEKKDPISADEELYRKARAAFEGIAHDLGECDPDDAVESVVMVMAAQDRSFKEPSTAHQRKIIKKAITS